MIRQIDSSLIEEWEKMRNPSFEAKDMAEEAPEHSHDGDITWDKKAFTIMIRNEVFRFVKCLSQGRYDEAVAVLGGDPVSTPTADALKSQMQVYFEGHSRLMTDQKARSPLHARVTPDAKAWKVQQILVDEEEHNDWAIDLSVDVSASREAGAPVISLVQITNL
jgi:hypothetical protein